MWNVWKLVETTSGHVWNVLEYVGVAYDGVGRLQKVQKHYSPEPPSPTTAREEWCGEVWSGAWAQTQIQAQTQVHIQAHAQAKAKAQQEQALKEEKKAQNDSDDDIDIMHFGPRKSKVKDIEEDFIEVEKPKPYEFKNKMDFNEVQGYQPYTHDFLIQRLID